MTDMAKLREVLTFFEQPVVLLNDDDHIVEHNKAAQNSLFSGDDVVGKRLYTAALSYKFDVPLTQLRQCCQDQEDRRCVVEHIDQFGNKIEWLLHKRYLQGYDALFAKILINNNSLAFSKDHQVSFDSVIEAFPGNVYWLDRNQICLGSNLNNLRMLGIRKISDFIGKSIDEVIPEPYLQKVKRTNEQIMASGRPLYFEEVGISDDGEKTIYISSKAPLINTSNEVVGLFGASIDIGAFKRTQELLRLEKEKIEVEAKSYVDTVANMAAEVTGSKPAASLIENIKTLRRFFESIIACMPGNVYWMNADSKYLGCNDNMKQVLGLKERDEIIGKTIFDYISEDKAKKIYALDKQILQTGLPCVVEEVAFNSEKQQAYYMTYKEPLIDPSKRVVGMVGISLDITKQKKAEALLKRAKTVAEKANQAKSDFLAMMTHELRTPLNIILGMTRIIREENLSPEKRDHYLETISQSGEALLQLINNILDFSKLQHGKLELHEEDFSIANLLWQIQAELSYKASEKNINFQLVVGRLPVSVHGDGQRLRQIIYNLCDNAIKFTEKGCVELEVQADVNADKVMLNVVVTDSGIGIPKAKLKAIFNEFTQVRGDQHDKYSRRYGGVGLGLSIVRKMVDLLGGQLSIESDTGKGTAFIINLPFTLVEAGAAVQPALAVAETNAADTFPGCRVLLVEDNPLNQKVMLHLLNNLKVDVEVANNGEEASQALTTQKFDLVFMDVTLPDISGIEVTKKYRSGEDQSQRLPIIALTAHAHSDDEKRCMDAGMDYFLVKPISPESLKQTLHRYYNSPNKF